MPRYRREHWTDGDGIGPPLKGVELAEKLESLEIAANVNHRKARMYCNSFLEHARLAGEALLEAKRRLGHKIKWSKWRAEHFEGSKRTSCDYMQIARYWDDERVVAAREAGFEINSVAKVLRIIRGQERGPNNRKENLPICERRANLRKAVMRQFRKKVASLSDSELTVLANFDVDDVKQMAGEGKRVIDGFWDEGYERLKGVVVEVYGDEEYYDPEFERRKREIRRRGKRRGQRQLEAASVTNDPSTRQSA